MCLPVFRTLAAPGPALPPSGRRRKTEENVSRQLPLRGKRRRTSHGGCPYAGNGGERLTVAARTRETEENVSRWLPVRGKRRRTSHGSCPYAGNGGSPDRGTAGLLRFSHRAVLSGQSHSSRTRWAALRRAGPASQTEESRPDPVCASSVLRTLSAWRSVPPPFRPPARNGGERLAAAVSTPETEAVRTPGPQGSSFSATAAARPGVLPFVPHPRGGLPPCGGPAAPGIVAGAG